MAGNTGLLIIDLQAGNFADPDPVYRGDQLLATIRRLSAGARAAGVTVVYVQHCGPEGAIDEPGTPGWEIHPALTPQQGDVVIQKHHPDAFQDTDLQRELASRGIERLILTGIQTEYCIDTTCRRAYSLGYEVTLVVDGHSTWDTERLTAAQIIDHHNSVLGGWFADLKEAEAIAFDSVPGGTG